MEPNFGAQIFEWKTGKGTAIAAIIVAILLVVGSIATGEPLAIAGAVLIAIGFVAATASSLVNTLRCYEHGLVKKNLFGVRQFAYSDVDVLTYQATRVVGVYAQTNFRLQVVPVKPHRKISLFGRYREGIEVFRDAVAAAVAKKMLDRLASEPEITWSGKVRLSRQGVHFQKPKFVGSEAVFIPFSENPQVGFDAGTFRLSGRDLVLRMDVGSPNFFPGYLAMQTLAAAPRP